MLNGSWEAIEVADLDNDGDQDLILGNQGTIHFIQDHFIIP